MITRSVRISIFSKRPCISSSFNTNKQWLILSKNSRSHSTEQLGLNPLKIFSNSQKNNEVRRFSSIIINPQKICSTNSYRCSSMLLQVGENKSTYTNDMRRTFSIRADDKKEDDSSTTEEINTTKSKNSTSDLRDTVHRLKAETNQKYANDTSSSGSDGSGAGAGAGAGASGPPILETIQEYLSTFSSEVAQTWQDLLNSGRPKGINKRINLNSKGSGGSTRPDYEGSSDLMIIDEDEHLGAWEKMQRRLSEAPIIQDILGKSHEIFEKSGAKKVKERLDDITDDAKEAWETSQNPWVYRMSSVYDTMTAETDMAIATRELQKLDPSFTMEQFKLDAVEHTIPEIMQYFLEGRIKELEPWLGEAVYKRLSAENKVRKDEGLIVDSNLLGIFNSEIVAVEMDKVEKEPIVLMHYMAQQINCVRNKDGEVVEGREDDIKANSYLMAFQRDYNEEDGSLNWKIVDFRFNGAIAWI